MKRTQPYGALAGTAVLSCTMLALAQTPPDKAPPPGGRDPGARPQQPSQTPTPGISAQAGYMQTPRYAQPLNTTLSENAIQVCKDKDFKGEQTTLETVIKTNRTGTLNELPATYDNDASSMRWNITPGVLVVLFDDAAGKGVQLALWGKGQIADFDTVDFDNSATRWAWYDVGGGIEPRSPGNMEMPHGAVPLAATIGDDIIQLFEDQNFAGTEEHKIGPVTRQNSGAWNMLPGNKENGLSSLRWNLPEGVIVMFSAEDNGNNNIIIFGEAQNPDLGICGFDNRASRWSWAYIGSAKTKTPDRDPGKQPGGSRP